MFTSQNHYQLHFRSTNTQSPQNQLSITKWFSALWISHPFLGLLTTGPNTQSPSDPFARKILYEVPEPLLCRSVLWASKARQSVGGRCEASHLRGWDSAAVCRRQIQLFNFVLRRPCFFFIRLPTSADLFCSFWCFLKNTKKERKEVFFLVKMMEGFIGWDFVKLSSGPNV